MDEVYTRLVGPHGPGPGRLPDVSVIVPLYNAMPYLTENIRSLANQTIGLDRLEIIYVDDGSTDGSGRRADSFARRHRDTVTVVHQATNSGGPAVPNNVALSMAHGRYVFFLGADDYLGPQALQRMVDAADSNGSDVVAARSGRGQWSICSS